MKRTKKRILKSENILSVLVKENDLFYVGITQDEYLSAERRKEFGLKDLLTENENLIPQKGGPISKTNLEGKLEREQPERKHTIRKHIEYTKKDGTFVSFDKDFNVYVKHLVGQFKMAFKCVKNKNGENLIISKMLKFDNDETTNKLNTHTINLFLEVFGIYDIYTENLLPALAYHKKYEFEILPSGEFGEDDKSQILEGVKRFVKNDEEVKALKERLDYIQKFKPKVVGSGNKGFQGYIVFEFKESGIALLESMYKDNATYVFDINEYEKHIAKDKQELIRNKLYKKRIKHTDKWEDKINTLLY